MVSLALGALGGRWKIEILFNLFASNVLRFSELEKSVAGISQKMLAQQLRELERDGFVARTIYPEVPPRVEYALTPTGESLKACLRSLREIGRLLPAR
jgi:DNA-binding HxlR family transcriptional regulator